MRKSDQVTLKWITNPPADLPAGVTFGVPWPRGTVKPGEPLCVNLDKKSIPTQAWPLAYWPDGSVKWSLSVIHALELIPAKLPVSRASRSSGRKKRART